MTRWLIRGICGLHLLFMALLLFSPRIAFKNKPHKPLAVRHLAMPVSSPAAPVKTAQAPAAPKAVPRPTPKKVSTPQPQPAPKKQQPVAQNSALAALAKELEKNIAHMETAAVQKKSTPSQKTARLQIDLQEESKSDYIPILTHFLHTALHLPDFGAVKMQLTVRRDGSVAKLLVLKTESEENRKYLETQIPLLRFPPLQGEYAKNGEHVFVLTFCNE